MLQAIKGNLVVSCQALENEPLHSPFIMAHMAKAAREGGAAGIRANGYDDIVAIRAEVNLPIIGIVKRDYPDSDVYITPTRKEVDELLLAKVEMIALDATNRKRPNHEDLAGLIQYIHHHGTLVIADISTVEEGIDAWKLGVDCLSTTLSGYTPYSSKQTGPDFELLQKLVKQASIPVIAEGHLNTPADAKKALELGAHSVVVGSAITRPQLITKAFVDGMRT